MNNIQNKITAYYSKLVSNNKNSHVKDVLMPEKILALIESLKESTNYEEMKALLEQAVSDKDITKINQTLYRSGDYYFLDSLRFRTDQESTVLKKLTEKNFSIAPKFVDVINKGDESILITKIEGTNGKDLIPFANGYHLLDNTTRNEALNDIKRLTQAGLINQSIFTRGGGSLFITPETKKIVITDWNMVRPIDASETKPLLDEAYEIIYRK